MSTNIIIQRINKGNLFFSILSLLSSLLLFLLIIFKSQLRTSLTYKFLMYIFISEILNSIGNIIQSVSYDKDNQIVILFFISFSDIFTNLLFLFFSISSIELIKKANRLIKDKTKAYIIKAFIISFVYLVIVVIIGFIASNASNASNLKEKINVRFHDYYSNQDKEKKDFSLFFYFFVSLIHTAFIMIITFFTTINFYNLLLFMFEKLKNDKVNAHNIALLLKILFRYPLILIIILLFFIIRIGFVTFCDENNLLRDLFYLFSDSLFCLRGFLISLNTMKSSKIQNIYNKFIQVNIKHYLLLNFGQFSSRKISEVKNVEEELLKE